jgi:hypothetical protein
MNISHYIGFDVHKKSIGYCVKTADGKIFEEGKVRATHDALRAWAGKRSEAWRGAMEATLFSGWIYDTLKPFAAGLQMGNPSMMKAIGAAKKKSASWMHAPSPTWCACNLLPARYVASTCGGLAIRLPRARTNAPGRLQLCRHVGQTCGRLAIGLPRHARHPKRHSVCACLYPLGPAGCFDCANLLSSGFLAARGSWFPQSPAAAPQIDAPHAMLNPDVQ